MNKYIFGGKSTVDVECDGTTDAKQYETTADAESEKKSESGIGSRSTRVVRKTFYLTSGSSSDL